MDELTDKYNAIKCRIFDALKESGITQKQFAEALEVSSQTITDWKKGKSNSFAGKVGKISEVLHTTPSWILFGEGEKYSSGEGIAQKELEKISSLKSALIDDQNELVRLLIMAMNHTLSLPRNEGVRVPVLGDVAAGIPIEAITDIVDYEEIDAAMAATGEFFGLRIKGSSMEPRMREGDVVIVRKQDTAETGDTVVALVNGSSATVKRIKYGPDGISLIPTNPVYDVQFFSAADVERLPVRVIGRVVELRAKY